MHMPQMNMQQMMKQARKMQEQLASQQMGAITGGLNIPGLM